MWSSSSFENIPTTNLHPWTRVDAGIPLLWIFQAWFDTGCRCKANGPELHTTSLMWLWNSVLFSFLWLPILPLSTRTRNWQKILWSSSEFPADHRKGVNVSSRVNFLHWLAKIKVTSNPFTSAASASWKRNLRELTCENLGWVWLFRDCREAWGHNFENVLVDDKLSDSQNLCSYESTNDIKPFVSFIFQLDGQRLKRETMNGRRPLLCCHALVRVLQWRSAGWWLNKCFLVQSPTPQNFFAVSLWNSTLGHLHDHVVVVGPPPGAASRECRWVAGVHKGETSTCPESRASSLFLLVRALQFCSENILGGSYVNHVAQNVLETTKTEIAKETCLPLPLKKGKKVCFVKWHKLDRLWFTSKTNSWNWICFSRVSRPAMCRKKCVQQGDSHQNLTSTSHRNARGSSKWVTWLGLLSLCQEQPMHEAGKTAVFL